MVKHEGLMQLTSLSSQSLDLEVNVVPIKVSVLAAQGPLDLSELSKAKT